MDYNFAMLLLILLVIATGYILSIRGSKKK